ncbi:MAG: hypothetical protein L3K19_04620 [Thermoplasmata archaeon]|nr:hypothetical protein [Thermoplasmata archaeon]
MALLVILILPALPLAGGAVSLQLVASSPLSGHPTIGPMTATSTAAGVGTCASTETASVPFLSGNARGSAVVAEPRTCPSNTRLIFLAALRFSNGLPVPLGHVLTVRLDAAVLNGTTGMLRNVQFYVQRIAFGNPIVTLAHVTILRGTLRVASTSTAVLAAGSTYGIGIRMQLTHLPLASTAQVGLVVYLVDADGGLTRVVDEQWAAFTFTY